MNINILNLSRKTTEEELVELFKAYGTVKSCDIVMDKRVVPPKALALLRWQMMMKLILQ